MHTFTGAKAHFHFNSDRSGNVIIVRAEDGATLDIPCSDVVAFVAELVRRERQARLDDATTLELLGLGP